MFALRRFPILLCMILIVAIGCSAGDQDAAPGAQGQAGATAEVVGFTGKVVETMDAGGYTYVHVESEEESGWAAGPVTAVAVGDEIFIPTEMFMVDFHSKTLDRTFEKLYFVEELAAPHSHADGQGHADGMTGHGAPKVAKDGDFSGIQVPEGGMTVADVWAQRNELVGQEVVVRGRVTKYNSGIMGRNWIHLQDGSGSETDGTHDLLVTTEAGIAAGNIITIRGIVALDQDFGSGYQYELLVEKASIE